MTVTKADLKAKQLKAMGVVGAEMQATSDMYDRVIAAGAKVAAARTAAETSQMAAIDEQIADLNEVAEDVVAFGNAAPTAGAGAVSSAGTTAPVKTSGAALDALNTAEPNPSKEAWEKGDAYVGTHGEG